MSVVKRHLMKSGVFPGCDNCCAACAVTPNGCVILREMIQRMMDGGRLRFEKVDWGRRIFLSATFHRSNMWKWTVKYLKHRVRCSKPSR